MAFLLSFTSRCPPGLSCTFLLFYFTYSLLWPLPLAWLQLALRFWGLPALHPLDNSFTCELPKCVFRSLLGISPETFPRHFMSQTEFLVSPTQSPSIPVLLISVGSSTTHSLTQAKNLEVRLDWFLSLTTHIHHFTHSFNKLYLSPVICQVLF